MNILIEIIMIIVLPNLLRMIGSNNSSYILTHNNLIVVMHSLPGPEASI